MVPSSLLVNIVGAYGLESMARRTATCSATIGSPASQCALSWLAIPNLCMLVGSTQNLQASCQSFPLVNRGPAQHGVAVSAG
jgi:hypothetical protein